MRELRFRGTARLDRALAIKPQTAASLGRDQDDGPLRSILGHQIRERPIEGRQASAVAECDRKNVGIGHLGVTPESLPSDVLVSREIDIVGPEAMPGKLRDAT